MKIKKTLGLSSILLGAVIISACGNKPCNLSKYMIEERHQIFTSSDNIYTATLSTGLRESNYCLDGIVNEKVDFAILSFYRNDNNQMAKDSYAYCVTVGENSYTGFLEKSTSDNSYIADLGIKIDETSPINAEISFTGYKYNQDLQNTSNAFYVNMDSAVKIANKELKENIKNVLNRKNTQLESVVKIVKDYSTSEIKNYYWYVGAISTDGDTFGILIDASTGEIIAKKA